jgi:hypothetical protein
MVPAFLARQCAVEKSAMAEQQIQKNNRTMRQ